MARQKGVVVEGVKRVGVVYPVVEEAVRRVMELMVGVGCALL